MQHGYDAHAAVPNSRLELFEGAGHFPQLDDPYRFAELLAEFVAETEPAAHDASVPARAAARGRLGLALRAAARAEATAAAAPSVHGSPWPGSTICAPVASTASSDSRHFSLLSLNCLGISWGLRTPVSGFQVQSSSPTNSDAAALEQQRAVARGVAEGLHHLRRARHVEHVAAAEGLRALDLRRLRPAAAASCRS